MFGNLWLCLCLIGVGVSRVGRSHQYHAIKPLVLYLDLDVQLSVLISNLLVGAANVDGCGEGNRHQTPFVANPLFEAMLQSMENNCG